MASKYMDLAIATAETSRGKYRLGAVVVKRSQVLCAAPNLIKGDEF